ncbi:hypothetical protein DM01DRAFT_1384195 [Hesseltinella vesiculosa]|uniref:Autophagy-related protein 29 n=1 Tax=Hesseltinella vesiculosa TaxID=101127 RepID=A0A1X2GEF7_9FUNG|nr:hypothetical protein DM01DRAFT_1384195 [Hesseltinella vesiculosa]
MNLDQEMIHVVVRLPFKRPPDFVEPTPVVWTDEMEQQLWKYLSQKPADWHEIADKLGVPPVYLARHAAFKYEKQLRDILRLGKVTSIPITPSTPTSPPVSSSSYVQRTPKMNQRPVSTSSSIRSTFMTSTVNANQPVEQGTSSSTGPLADTSMATATAAGITSKQSPSPPHMLRATPSPSHPDDASSMMLSTISTILPRQEQPASSIHSPLIPHSHVPSRHHSPARSDGTSMSVFHDTASAGTPSSGHWPGTDVHYQPKDQPEESHENAAAVDDSDFHDQFAKMQLAMQEEPAFLPSRRSTDGSFLLNSLRLSSSTTTSGTPDTSSRATPNLQHSSRLSYQQTASSEDGRPLLTQPSSSSMASSNTVTTNPATSSAAPAIGIIPSPNEHMALSLPALAPMRTDDSLAHQSSSQNQRRPSSSASQPPGKQKQVLMLHTRDAHLASGSQANSGSSQNSSALNSMSSSFSDLSDSSVTRSAMEDAFLSKLNHGSKMSSLAFSRKYN